VNSNGKDFFMKKNILIIATGGTIAGVGKNGSYEAGKIDINELVNEIDGIADLANLEMEQKINIDSSDITCENWLCIAKYINEKSKDSKIDGFVITHGTDTLEETAYFLNLTLKTSKPVVITGAMRPSTALSADGKFNLYQAVALARNEDSIGKGVLIVFSDTIYGARDVQKINSFKVEAFNHRDLGCLGYMMNDASYFYNSSIKPHTLDTEFDVCDFKDLPKVSIAYFYADADVENLKYFAENSEGIVMAGVGIGNCSEIWHKEIKSILEKNIPVVRTSRSANGLVTSDKSILEYGITANTLSAQKARILLSLSLTKTKNLEEIDKIFKKY
jgi:L-asparaginase